MFPRYAARSHQVDVYDQRSWVGGKVASWQDKNGNHIEVRQGNATLRFYFLIEVRERKLQSGVVAGQRWQPHQGCKGCWDAILKTV